MSDGFLVVITDGAGQRWFHRSRWRTLTVGRSDACELVLGSTRVSRRHLHIGRAGKSDDELVVTDLGSSGGTFVNGLRVEGRSQVPDAAVVEAGPFLLEVFVDAEPPEGARPWPHTGGNVAPAVPERAPLADDAEAISLRSLIDWVPLKPLPLRLVAVLGMRLLEEVQRLHARGQLAHTLPPEWIWVGKAGALAIRPEAPPEMAAGGEFDRYGSPELFDRPDADVRSDVFATGVVLYELLTGRHPFEGAGRRAGTLPLRGPFTDVRQLRGEVGREVNEVVATALEACPDDRYGSIPAFLKDFEVGVEASMWPSLPDGVEAALEPYFMQEPPRSQVNPTEVDGTSDAPFMVRIEVDDPDGEGTSVTFPGHGEITLGRHHSNDLVLLSLRMSRRHARFRFEDGRIFLEDMGSANGTYVNGQKVRSPTAVAVGDRIEMGGVRIKLFLDEAPAPHLFLVLHRADEAPRRVALHGRAKVTIGSDEEADVPLDGDGVAARHARLIVWGDRLQLESLDASMPIRIGPEPLEGTQLLAPDDIVTLGDWLISAALDVWPDSDAHDAPEASLLPAPGDRVRGFGPVGTLTKVVQTEQAGLVFRTHFLTRRTRERVEQAQLHEAASEQRRLRSSHLHPVVGAGHDHDDGPYLDRACLPGASLGTLTNEPMPLDVVIAVGEGLIEGVRDFCDSPLVDVGRAEAPASGVVALVAPSTVFLRADGRVLWSGLSLGMLDDLMDPDGGDVQGVAPEQLVVPGRHVDAKALMFGMGVVLYRCATGRAPFGEGADLRTVKAAMKDKPLNPQDLVPSIPTELVRYLGGLLDKDPAVRFRDLDTALIELRAVRDLSGPARPPRLAVREWLKARSLKALEEDDVVRHDEVTAEIQLASLTEEGPSEG